MHKIASHLSEYDCYFSQIYDKAPHIQLAIKAGLLEKTIISGPLKQRSEEYLKENMLKNDYAGSVYDNKYDLAVLCTDLIIPNELRKIKTIFVQEGMTDMLTKWGRIVKALGLPPYMALDTSLNGSSNRCDVYCVASQGYKNYFSSMGTDESKLIVTGIPNFDNVKEYMNNDFPLKHYVMVATSDIRECFGIDNRKKFIADAVSIAAGRQLLFKLHPNEIVKRAVKEIKDNTPADTIIYTTGNANHMIANCDELITQYSTLVYVGIVLGKKVHSYFDVEQLKRLVPEQNDGVSAKNIAWVCRNYVEYKGTKENFLNTIAKNNRVVAA